MYDLKGQSAFFPSGGFWRVDFIKDVNFVPRKCVPVTISFPHSNFRVHNKAESVYLTIQKVKVCFVSKWGFWGDLFPKKVILRFENMIVTPLNSRIGLNFGPTCINLGIK